VSECSCLTSFVFGRVFCCLDTSESESEVEKSDSESGWDGCESDSESEFDDLDSDSEYGWDGCESDSESEFDDLDSDSGFGESECDREIDWSDSEPEDIPCDSVSESDCVPEEFEFGID
jgi:hypothetical protein